MPKRLIVGCGVVLVVALAGAPLVRAQAVALQPAPGKHHADPERSLDRLERARIEYFAGELAKACNVEVLVAVVPSLGGKKARVLADELGTAWGVGKSYKGRGCLLLLPPRDGDSQLRVTEALNEFAIDDADAESLLNANGVPLWKERRWGEGCVAVVRAIDRKIRAQLKKPAALEPTPAQLDALEPPEKTAAGGGAGGGGAKF